MITGVKASQVHDVRISSQIQQKLDGVVLLAFDSLNEQGLSVLSCLTCMIYIGTPCHELSSMLQELQLVSWPSVSCEELFCVEDIVHQGSPAGWIFLIHITASEAQVVDDFMVAKFHCKCQ